MTMWVGSSLENYMYACKIGIALTLEYTRRFGMVDASSPIPLRREA